MKKVFATFLVAISFSSFTQITITEPTEVGSFVYVDKNDGAGQSLEKITARAFSSNDISGTGTTLNMKGATSTVQIKKKEIMQFVYHIGKTKSGAQLIGFKLVILTPEKNSRKIITNVHPINEDKSVYPQVIGGLQTAPYGSNSLLISANGLMAGEYAFVSGDHDLKSSYFESELKPFYAFTVVE